jgi:glycerol-3-phosphate O-acyltransferase
MSHRDVYLIEEVDRIDREILDDWVRQTGNGDAEVMVVSHPRALSTESLTVLATRLRAGDDPSLTPLRVVWRPQEHDGRRAARLRDIPLGDPRHPARWRKQYLRRHAPDCAVVVAGEPARVSELEERYLATGAAPRDSLAFAAFVARQAALARERAEYRVLGAQYKVPRLVREEIVASPEFQTRAKQLAADLGRDEEEVWAEIGEYLDEMVTGYSRYLLDLMARLGRMWKRQGYGDEVDYDPAQLERVKEEMSKHPVVVMPSHKSNLDALVIPAALFENGLPPTHTFAGINMAFWPFGPIYRRSGRIFIRRDTRDNPVYRWVLREYIGYVVEKRFNLEWYIEGTRSRTGKLGPPKMGLLRYVVDAFREGRTDDVAMLPVSIVYDQLHEVSEFAAEARGAAKKAETIGWAVRFYRAQRHPFGKIYVRFGEPLSLRAALASDQPGPLGKEDENLQLQKLAFEVCTRINAVTPITASALVCMVLLSTRGRALSASELHTAIGRVLGQIRVRRLPLAASAETLDTLEGVEAVAASLATRHTIDAYEGGPERVYSVAAGHHHAAAFYRNTMIHFFVDGAVAELALVHAGERDGDDRLNVFWDEAYELRDLLKFDFFFEQRDAFRKALATELTARLPDWEEQLSGGTDPVRILEQLQPLHAFSVLRPFIEAYLIVARALVNAAEDEAVDEAALVRSSMAMGEQYVRQQRVRSPETVSKQLFASAVQLAANRGLTKPGDDLRARREAFGAELADVERRIDVVEQLTYDAWGLSLTASDW